MAKRIYLIDDERAFTDLLKSLLEFEGFEVESSNNPTLALEFLKQNSFDVIILDMMMPEMDGINLIKQLKSNPNYSKTILYVLSAKRLSNEERQFLLTENIHFIPKPFEPNRLVDLLKRHSENPSSPAAP